MGFVYWTVLSSLPTYCFQTVIVHYLNSEHGLIYLFYYACMPTTFHVVFLPISYIGYFLWSIICIAVSSSQFNHISSYWTRWLRYHILLSYIFFLHQSSHWQSWEHLQGHHNCISKVSYLVSWGGDRASESGVIS